MKPKLAIISLLLFAGFLSAGFNSQKGENGRVWVFFKDRPYTKARTLHPAQITDFKQASIQRRKLRGISGWEDSDYAVDPQYVKAVRDVGGRIRIESRWLNAVSANCDAQCRKKVLSLHFVSGLIPVRTYRRPLETIEEVRGIKPLSSTNSNGLNYGLSKEQLMQLNVPQVHNKGFAGQEEIVAIFDSGFRKDHKAFAGHEIVAEKNYVFGGNNVYTHTDADYHGTGTWSLLNGEAPGKLYGPAYKAKVILAVTEDARSETIVEEDNWVAAFEFADRLGATVISSSVGHTDWYGPADFNGVTAITSRVASMAAKKGILVVNAVGNHGPEASTLVAPADAKNILAVGAVDPAGDVPDFSSRGPTADGRIKPEVVARGLYFFAATAAGTNSYVLGGNGTSWACPLTAGCAAVLFSARQDWTPLQAREAIMMTASRAAIPDNTYGYGVVNLLAAMDYLPLNSVVIDHKPLKNTADTAQPYKVQARIRAQRGIKKDQLFVFWKPESTGVYLKVPLTAIPNSADQFQGSIPPQLKGTHVLYYITAKDSQGKQGKYPVKAPTEVLQFNVI